MDTYIWAIIGMLFGSLVSNIMFAIRSGYGTLRIDTSNPEKDVYRIELDSINNVSHKKYITLRVDSRANLHSQK